MLLSCLVTKLKAWVFIEYGTTVKQISALFLEGPLPQEYGRLGFTREAFSSIDRCIHDVGATLATIRRWPQFFEMYFKCSGPEQF